MEKRIELLLLAKNLETVSTVAKMDGTESSLAEHRTFLNEFDACATKNIGWTIIDRQ